MLKPARHNESIAAPVSWRDMPAGDILKNLVEEEVNRLTERCFGYHMVKLGELSNALELTQCKIPHVINQTESKRHTTASNEQVQVVGTSTALPYREKSIDAFLLVHELDFAQDPHQILRQIDRCLVPNGHVIIVGFNPYSLAGLAKFLPFKMNNALHRARFFSRGRVSDWLGLLGYQVTDTQSFAFSELLFDRKIDRNSKLQRLAEKYFSVFASIYVIVGKKREFPLSLIKPVWKPKPKFSPVGASIRINGENS